MTIVWKRVIGKNLQRRMMCNWEIYWCLDMKETWNLKFPSLIQVIVIGNMQSICKRKKKPILLKRLPRNLNSKLLPKQFAMANGLINKKCGVIIGDERQRPWNLRLATHDCRVHVVGGWGKFRVANDLKEGDHLMFEVVANGEKPIWKFHKRQRVIKLQK
ncbi:hypothetical protein K7X08_027314 [Anisodus acutangulus]|uniref:TF-B3 domain-containing protein n=1 Tax=Anisodus acutangulus TaxID=402998 RepID=A0A9Q1MK04_9SOLA|nr:hypothetical protein K7X08_027314 [Anisodus acutangulus]